MQAPLCYEVSVISESLWDASVREEILSAEQIEIGCKKVFNFDRFSMELFNLLYQDSPDKVAITPEGQWASVVFAALLELRQLEELKKEVAGDVFYAQIGAGAFLKPFADELPEPDAELLNPGDIRKAVICWQKHLPNPAIESLIESLKKKGSAMSAELKRYALYLQNEKSGELEELLVCCCLYAIESVRYQKNITFSYQGGDDGRNSISGASIEAKKTFMSKIAGSKKLQEISDLAGKMKLRSRAIRAKSPEFKSAIKGVVTGNDLSSVLAQEFAYLGTDSTRLMFLDKFINKRLLQYDKDGWNKKGRGPLVILLDNTNSMTGAPEVWSKSVVLALMHNAANQKRHVRIIHYGKGAREIFDFPRGEQNPLEVLKAIEYFYADHHNVEPLAFDDAVECIKEQESLKNADIIHITDGGCCWHYTRFGQNTWEEWISDFKSTQKRLGFNVYGVLIGQHLTDEMREITQHWVALSDLQNDAEIDRLFLI